MSNNLNLQRILVNCRKMKITQTNTTLRNACHAQHDRASIYFFPLLVIQDGRYSNFRRLFLPVSKSFGTSTRSLQSVNTRLHDARCYQKAPRSYTVVEGIRDNFLDIVTLFAHFVSCGAHELYGKYKFGKEKSSNPAFAHGQWVTQL